MFKIGNEDFLLLKYCSILPIKYLIKIRKNYYFNSIKKYKMHFF
jgi:hypothetical protein